MRMRPGDIGYESKPLNSTDTAGYSLFHQLHCLETMREGYYNAVNGSRDNHFEHVSHCFDYIRQAVLCNSDTALEWIPLHQQNIDGWGFEHRCRNFDEVYRYTLEHRKRD